MGLVKQFSGKNVFLDTAPIIYYIEGNKGYKNFLDDLFELNIKGKIHFSTSSLTLLELLVVPLWAKRFDLVEQHKNIFLYSNNFNIIDLDINISKKAARFRTEYIFNTHGSIQLASATNSKSDFFLTSDKQLKQDKMKTIVLKDFLDNKL